MSQYTIGTSNEGADAYPPLLLFKCFFVEKVVSHQRMVSLKSVCLVTIGRLNRFIHVQAKWFGNSRISGSISRSTNP